MGRVRLGKCRDMVNRTTFSGRNVVPGLTKYADPGKSWLPDHKMGQSNIEDGLTQANSQNIIATTPQHPGNHPKYLSIIAASFALTSTTHIFIRQHKTFLPLPK